MRRQKITQITQIALLEVPIDSVHINGRDNVTSLDQSEYTTIGRLTVVSLASQISLYKTKYCKWERNNRGIVHTSYINARIVLL